MGWYECSQLYFALTDVNTVTDLEVLRNETSSCRRDLGAALHGPQSTQHKGNHTTKREAKGIENVLGKVCEDQRVYKNVHFIMEKTQMQTN